MLLDSNTYLDVIQQLGKLPNSFIYEKISGIASSMERNWTNCFRLGDSSWSLDLVRVRCFQFFNQRKKFANDLE